MNFFIIFKKGKENLITAGQFHLDLLEAGIANNPRNSFQNKKDRKVSVSMDL